MEAMVLPQINAHFEPAIEPPSTVIVAGGRAPGISWLREVCCSRDVWAVDRGLDSCMSADIVPSLFIGDGDSVSRKAMRWSQLKRVTSILFPPEKNLTDLQLALKEAGGKGSSAIITGAFGGRFDHLFANVYSLIWAEEEWGPRVRCMADEKEVFFLIRGGESLSLSGLERGTVFSTLALSEECSGIDMKGAKWQVGEGRLLLREPFAISNILSGDAEGALFDRTPLRVSLSSGWLGVYFMTSLSAEQDQKGRF